MEPSAGRPGLLSGDAPATDLKARLEREIALTGPLSVADYVTRCLHDPRAGYYATRPAIGPDGDFLTAPLVSQMFGELIGLWLVETWSRMGAPGAFRFVEVGPGDGTLMADILRAARVVPAFIEACRLTLVEPSAPLRALQAGRLTDAPVAPVWADSLAAIDGQGPVLLVANEVLDCLPARQIERTPDGWAERMVGLDADGHLAFRLGPVAPGFVPPPYAVQPGQVAEQSEIQTAFARAVAGLIRVEGGAALLIDYGRDTPGPGDTLQALSRHRKVDPLATPGQADLTQWADFAAVLEEARLAGVAVAPLLTQGEFLTRLGLTVRADRLKAAQPDSADILDRQVARLISPDQMGNLFKVAALHSPDTLTLPAFEVAP
ncbi:class I SAM-dependent methyltransferase [Brevundimonas poindexterae]|uniref:class I SAM-dependent methyltransferase n=1 Tax=Brevundimonas poindexterae TaxID=74325 RepID=UPI001CFE9593|nr:SAM-dependent methyltransferase [Brevundimonas poindexterae]